VELDAANVEVCVCEVCDLCDLCEGEVCDGEVCEGEGEVEEAERRSRCGSAMGSNVSL
jgi:hypothetical protein